MNRNYHFDQTMNYQITHCSLARLNGSYFEWCENLESNRHSIQKSTVLARWNGMLFHENTNTNNNNKNKEVHNRYLRVSIFFGSRCFFRNLLQSFCVLFFSLNNRHGIQPWMILSQTLQNVQIQVAEKVLYCSVQRLYWN